MGIRQREIGRERKKAIESERKTQRRERHTLQTGEVGILRFSLQQVREASVPVAKAAALRKKSRKAK